MNPEPCAPFRSLSWPARAVAGLSVALLASLTVLFWPAWRHDPDLSHGFFVPILSALLLYESRKSGEGTFGKAAGLAVLLCAASLLALLCAGVYAAVLDWTHALVGTLLGVCACLMCLAAWLALSDRSVRWMPRNWPALAALLLWILAAPLPPGGYAAVSAALQSSVTSVVMATLHVAGIAAYREGNVIELARTTVGVSEACSGVRSLISSLAAGLFLSGFVTTRTRSRITLIVLAPLIALGFNYLRSLILTVVASTGIDIEGAWHDATGTAIILATSAALLWLALRLDRGRPASTRRAPAPHPARTPASVNAVLAGLCSLLVAAVLLARATHAPDRPAGRPIDLEALLPRPPEGWILYPEGDMKQYADILRTDTLASRTYIRKSGESFEQVTIYLAYWLPGQAPVSLVASHTPDACWPGTGWVSEPVPRAHAALQVGGRTLADAESRNFVNSENGFSENVWFWHLYGGRPLAYENPYAFSRLFTLAVRYGFQHDRDQLFVRVSSNRPWSEIASEPIISQFFASVGPLGL